MVALLVIGGALAVVMRSSGEARPTSAKLPHRPLNVVMVMTDDQTVNELRVMPGVRDLLGRHGAVFRESFVSFPLCCPSRATFFSGQYAHNHHVDQNSGVYQKFDHGNTLPVWLRRAGYYTAHIGKYLNGYDGRDRTGAAEAKAPPSAGRPPPLLGPGLLPGAGWAQRPT